MRDVTAPTEPMPEVIKSYSVADDYGAFSNIAPYPTTLKKKRWPTSEHYF